MRRLLTVLGAIGLVIVIVGAVNHAVEVRVDYLVGTSSDVSVFWFALAVAILVVAAGVLGMMAGRASQASDRRKLEKELEDTYRRLREAQAALPAPVVVTPPEPSGAQTVIAAESVVAPTVVAAEAVEPGTDELDTTFSPPRHEAETGVVPPAVEPQTVVEPAADQGGERAEAVPQAEPDQPGADARSDEVQPPLPPV